MKTLLGLAAVVLFSTIIQADETKAVDVKFERHSGYFEKNNSGLKGESSYLAISDSSEFGKTFGVAFVKKPSLVPDDAWGRVLIASVIKRGNATFTYTIEKVTRTGDTLTVAYKATRGTETSAKFATPLILSVEKGDLKEVVFVENGKDAATVKVSK